MTPQDILDAYPGEPPRPTAKDPFAQVKWIYAQRAGSVPSRSGRQNYTTGLDYHLQFLVETRGRSPATLSELWGVTTLIEFKKWVSIQDGIGSHSRVGIVSALRASMREAVVLDCIAEFANASMPSPYRETPMHKVYSQAELEAVLEVVRVEHAFTLDVLRGYVPTGVGRDPRETAPEGQRGTHPSRLGFGWKVPANMRWYFENVMNCVAVQKKSEGAQKYARFLHHAGVTHGGLRQVYRSWGVTACVDGYVLGPLVLQLQYLTGLNPYSLITLQTDCIGKHPLLQTTHLSYRKMRSTGDKQLLLDLLNGVRSSLDFGDFIEDRAALQREQAVLIERCIGRILKLTENIRKRADPKVAKFLFIYESSGPRAFGQVLHFDLGKVNLWCHKQVDARGLCADDGTRLSFNLVRFRPTRLTEMARQGKDFFEIQQYAGHADIVTTIDYIDEHTYGALADEETARALETIWSNKREFEEDEQARLSGLKVIPIQSEQAEPFETLMCKCKNVFNPPARVRQLSDYLEGQGCPRHDMCLFCDNILLTVNDLPYIAYYRGQIQRALSPDSSTDVPHRKLYQKSLSILNQILDYETSEFTPEQIDRAIELSLDVDLVIDWLIYVATEEC